MSGNTFFHRSKRFSERYECPRCGGVVADGKYIGYEDSAYCLECHQWIDLKDLKEKTKSDSGK